MLTTPSNIISRSMRLIRAIGSGETPTADEITDGLDALNAMLDSWWNERLAVFAIQEQSFPLVAGTQDYTIGPAGTFNTGRPLKIEKAYVRLTGVDYPVSIIDETRWANIGVKNLSGIPYLLYYEPAMPLGVIHLFYVPTASTDLFIGTRRQIQNFATASTTIDLPPGYVDALCFNLAVRLAPEYEVNVPPDVMRQATKTFANIKRVNATPPQIMYSEAALLDTRRGSGSEVFGRYPVP